MVQIRYICKEHGKFSVEIQHVGGWHRRGAAPESALCPACEKPCGRVYRLARTLSVSGALFARLKEYGETMGVPMRQILEVATRDPDLLQRAADRILRRRADSVERPQDAHAADVRRDPEKG